MISKLTHIKRTLFRKLKFLKRLIGDAVGVGKIFKLKPKEEMFSSCVTTDFQTAELISYLGGLVIAKESSKGAKILVEMATSGSSKRAIAIANEIIKYPEFDELRAITLWFIIHHKGMESLIKVLSVGMENIKFYTPPKIRVIDAQGGEYFSIRAKGMNYSAVMANALDKFIHEIEYAQQFNHSYLTEIDNIRNIALNHVRPKLTSGALSDTNAVDLAFQATGLVLGKIFGKSLWSGKTIETSHSFVVQLDKTQQPYIFALFHDVKPWYLMIGTYKGTKNYIYLPEENVVILLRGLEHEWYELDDYIQGFQNLSQIHCMSFNHYLNSKTKPALYSGGISNLGHYFWNEVQGIFNASRNGLLQSVVDAVLYKNQYLDLKVLFPELSLMNVHYPKSPDEAFVACIESKLFCIHPSAFSMTSECADLIRKTSWQLADELTKEVIKKSDKANVKVWFNLRAHNKSWVNQVEGAVVIVNYLCEKYTNVILVLDGLPDCMHLVEAIKKELDRNVIVIDCTSISLPNSISWACNVDFYIATIGSGLCLNTWIAEKPGVAHSETSHLDQIEMWQDVRSDIKIPLVPSRKKVVDLSNGAYCNYEIKPSVMLDLVKAIA